MPGTHIVAPIVCGWAAIALGVIPGLLSGLIDGFHESFTGMFPTTSRRPHASGNTSANEQIWFIVVGISFLLLALIAYLLQ